MKLTNQQLSNAKQIVDQLNNVGIDNRLMQVAIVAVCFKESGLIPRRENLKYSAKRIKECWPKITDEIISTLKLENNEVNLGNFLYGGRFGNLPNEGYKYRGGGHNQITFKNIYASFGVSPDEITDPKIAAIAAAKFFKQGLTTGVKLGKFKKFNVENLDQVKDFDSAVKIAIQTNAGLNTNFQNGLVQEGYKKSISVYKYLDSVL